MASGSIVGEGSNEVPREKQRLLATKVYTRKSFRGHRKNVEGVAASVTPSSAEASPDVPPAEGTVPLAVLSVSNTEKKVLRQSGDAEVGTSGAGVRETDARSFPTDKCGIDTVSACDLEKGIRKSNGDVVMEETVEEPHANASKGTVTESEAPQPTETVVAVPLGFASEEDAVAGPQARPSVEAIVAEAEACSLAEATKKVHPLQEGVEAKPVDHPSREAMMAESPACPSDDMVAEAPSCPPEDMLAESPAHTSEDMVVDLPARPSEDTIAEPAGHSLEDTIAEPTARPSEVMAMQSTTHHLEDVALEPPACPSEDAAAGPGGGPADNLLVELVAPSSNGIPRKRKAVGLEDATMGQQQSASLPDAPSDNSMSHNRQVEMASAAGNGQQNGGLESRVRVNVSSRTRHEKIELRRKLERELAVVRGLVKRIEAKQGQLGLGVFTGLRVSVNDGVDGGIRRVTSDIGSFGVPRESTAPLRTPTPRQSRPLSQLNISVMENGQGVGESFEKEKRTPKANQFYRNSDFLLAKDKFPPAESNKKSKSNGKKHTGELGLGFGPNTKVFKSCNALLERLMKHKHGWVFNTPVDVEGLRLHDYYTIIKHPMDLGTVKSRLGKNWYKTPEEFAEDVRLTFHNAMTYNPKGQDVHFMAEQLLKIFEDKWATIRSDCDREMRFTTTYHMGVRTPPPRKAPLLPVAPLDMSRILERSESMTYSSFETRPKSITTTPSARAPAPKKPKAKDPNKRDMTYEEKQKLSTNLQNLPSEKLDNIVQIIKKRNSTLSQHDDEIEVDIDSVDAETLWELDRFVTNYKKSLSKNKRKAELATQARAEAQQKVQEKTPAPIVIEAPKDSNTNRDERNIPTSSPQAEKQGDNGSRSSSSSSSSSDSGSSSSDSDSDSSSASGSDVGH